MSFPGLDYLHLRWLDLIYMHPRWTQGTQPPPWQGSDIPAAEPPPPWQQNKSGGRLGSLPRRPCVCGPFCLVSPKDDTKRWASCSGRLRGSRWAGSGTVPSSGLVLAGQLQCAFYPHPETLLRVAQCGLFPAPGSWSPSVISQIPPKPGVWVHSVAHPQCLIYKECIVRTLCLGISGPLPLLLVSLFKKLAWYHSSRCMFSMLTSSSKWLSDPESICSVNGCSLSECKDSY